ncbi:hypothetical protein DPMN_076058 [Dreissena polymorpha]|uniref:Uncharacterized protein n=1 Tax=Dreissena polymorpha TaxID=45954 RepID=A0A9D4BM25_DREPO|nr:hypothetical protein DPMN_076058 [Dreissena polymorpha]
MSQFRQRPQVLAPALEGSKEIIPYTARIPAEHRPFTTGPQFYGNSPQFYGNSPQTSGGMAFYPRLPPLNPYMGMMSAERFQVPSLLSRPRPRYMGPPSLMPYWGGYSYQGQYYPAQRRTNLVGSFAVFYETMKPCWNRILKAFANSLDPDETPQNVVSHQDPNCWLQLVLSFRNHLEEIHQACSTTGFTLHELANVRRTGAGKSHPVLDKEKLDLFREATVVKQEPKTPEAVPRQVIPVPIRMPKKVAQAPPIYVQQPPPPPKKTVNGKTETLPRKGFAWGFWRVGMAALFVMHLKSLKRRPQNSSNRPSSMFLFGIILKEIVAALHRIYLNPNGNIYPVLNDIIGPNCYDLAELIHGGRGMGAKDESVLIQELQYVIENVIYHITEIMPTTGVLGTHRKSAVFELIRSGKRFPDGYFWQVEMDRLQLTDQGRTVNVGDSEGFMLMLGIFISRSLVTTILMKPMDYGLSNTPLSDIAERNLRIVATALLYLIRRISISRGRGIMDMPSEIAEYLYTDEEMDYIYGKLSRTFNYCEGLLREWGTEYIRRLRASSMQS